MAKNKELYDYIAQLRGEDIVARQGELATYLGVDLDTVDLTSIHDNASAISRAVGLYREFSSTTDDVQITHNGPPTHEQIINLCKWKYTLAYQQSALSDMNLGSLEDNVLERALRNIITVANLDFADDKGINKTILRNAGIELNELATSVTKQDLLYYKKKAREKLEASKATPGNKVKIEHIELHENIQVLVNAQEDTERKLNDLIGSIDQTTVNLDTKKGELRQSIAKLEGGYKGKSTKKTAKEAIAKELTKLRSQLTLIEITSDKLRRIKQRTDESLSNARNTLYNDSYGLYRKVSNKSGLNFYLIPNLGDFNVEAINAQADDLQEEVLCFVDNDTFRYLYLDSSGNIKRGVISLNDINLVPPVDVNAADVRSKLIAELERRQHKFDLYPAFVENHPNAAKQIAKDTTRYRNMQMQFDELNGDIARCESVKRFADSVVANPEKQLHANSPVNAFVEVMSLADMQTFDANGEPYFRDEIVNCQTNTAREHDDRTRFGITGEVVTRGVYINPGEVKRSTYVTPGSNDQQPRIVIETSHAKAKKDGKPTVQITSRSAANLSEDEKNLLAFKMAKEMLLQYREGDKKHKIVLESKNPAHADQAARVYAALLMLTSADDAHQDRIKLNPSQIKVKVDGCDKPRFFTKSMDSKKQFYEKYFQDKSQIKAMRDEVTSVYRQKRQDIGADLKPDASEDTHSINVDNRQRITK